METLTPKPKIELLSLSIKDMKIKLLEEALKFFPNKTTASKALGLVIYKNKRHQTINLLIRKYLPHLASKYIVNRKTVKREFLKEAVNG